MEENKENVVLAEKQPKLWLAILCAVGLGLVGCVLWGVLYYLGYIAWIAAFVVVFAAAWGYKKFNLKMDVKGYIIVALISILEIVLTIFLVLAIVVAVELQVGFGEAFSLMFQVIGESAEVKNALIIDVVLSVVMIILAFVTFFFTERRASKQAKEASNVTEVNSTVIDVKPVDAGKSEDTQANKEEKKGE